MPLHVFVAMPFGIKPGFDGAPIDFNRVYAEYIKPDLEWAGFEVFRADEESRAGDIRSDMFQELLLADLLVADLTLDNPNVWYELGVRHALRARGVVIVQSERPYQPFDIYTDRKLRYRLTDGAPDPERLEQDRRALIEMALDTVCAWHGRKVSPVYQLLPYLQEPGWKSLRLGGAKEFWDAYDAWNHRIQSARGRQCPGDIQVLAAEAPIQALRIEACRTAGASLVALGQFAFALERYEEALKIAPEDLESRRQKGMILGKLGRLPEARAWLRAVVRDHPGDAETLALAGRIEKDAWTAGWRVPGKAPGELRRDAALEDGYLGESIRWYAAGFRADPGHYYSGINALTLMRLHGFVTGNTSMDQEADALTDGGESPERASPAAGKRFSQAITAAVLLAIGLIGYGTEQLNQSSVIGGLAVSVTALILGIAAYYDANLGRAKGRRGAIVVMALSAVMTLVFIGELEEAQAPAPVPVPGPLAVPAQESGALNLSGAWHLPNGSSWLVQHSPQGVQFQEFTPGFGVTASGTGRLVGNRLDVVYTSARDRRAQGRRVHPLRVRPVSPGFREARARDDVERRSRARR